MHINYNTLRHFRQSFCDFLTNIFSKLLTNAIGYGKISYCKPVMEKSRSWSSARDWKSRNRQKRFEGSNPSFSATAEAVYPSRAYSPGRVFCFIIFPICCHKTLDIEFIWGISAVGSAQHWQCWGQGFESPILHQAADARRRINPPQDTSCRRFCFTLISKAFDKERPRTRGGGFILPVNPPYPTEISYVKFKSNNRQI